MSRVAPGRHAAYLALRAVVSGRSDLPDALARSRERLADSRDQALAATLAAGTLRWMGALDAVIAAFTKRPTSRLDPEVLDILRLGAFQLLHMDRLPARAIVDDGVEMTREQRKSSASGMVNAVLRRIDRERDRLPLPGRDLPLDYLSTTLSHPRWLAERWLAARGFDATEAWMRFDNSPAPLALRANTVRVSRSELRERLAAEGVATDDARFAPEGLVVRDGQPIGTPLHQAGAFVVQDESSQLVAAVAAARPGERVLDACASPGGKTVAMAGDMEGTGMIAAGDLRVRRVALLRETTARAGADVARVLRHDAERLPFGPVFDLVLIDAPCSGLGTIRRDPEIRWRRQAADLPALAAVQRRMLACAAGAVKPGGRLVYSTCSSEPEENEAVVEDFVEGRPEFVALRREVNPGALRLDERLFTPEGYLRTTPHEHGLEAFFAAVLRRER